MQETLNFAIWSVQKWDSCSQIQWNHFSSTLFHMLAPVLKCCSTYSSLHLCWMIGKNWLVFFLMTLPTILGVFVTLKFRFCLVPYNFFVCEKMELRQLIVSECVGLPEKIARYVLALSIFCQNYFDNYLPMAAFLLSKFCCFNVCGGILLFRLLEFLAGKLYIWIISRIVSLLQISKRECLR